ncbi:MAG: 2-oxo acid dehydrogenase subunit E2 [Ardenticatenales bacterium]|nr:2-oxo acid dehydrogenase subunit E2 [Ardenticatenales bacterium]
MAIAISMPQLGESVTEGTVGRWLKQVGDRVEKYEPLLEVISDKVDTEITATEGGTLLSIEIEEGATVPVGTVLCYLGEAGESTGQGGGAPTVQKTPVEMPVAPPIAAPAPPPSPRLMERLTERAVPAPVPEPATKSNGAAQTITPVVARMLSEHNIDLSQVQGSGREGRVTKRDIEEYLERRGQPAAPAPTPAMPTPPPVAQPAAAPVAPTPTVAPIAPATPPAPQIQRPAPPAPAPAARPIAAQPGELLPLTNMRRRIAEHMVNSKRTAPHVTTVFEADLGAISAHRNANRRDFEARGVRLTFMPYFVEAVVHGLRNHPLANSTFTEDGIQLLKDLNIGVAVATQGGAGLLVPVVRRADEKNLFGLARDMDDITQRARRGGLTPDDMGGGTFTISNHGVGGSLWGTPIINQPQSAILGIGKIQKRVVVTKEDAIAIRPMVYLSLTFDHRVLDGATADAFMADVVNRLEQYR